MSDFTDVTQIPAGAIKAGDAHTFDLHGRQVTAQSWCTYVDDYIDEQFEELVYANGERRVMQYNDDE